MQEKSASRKQSLLEEKATTRNPEEAPAKIVHTTTKDKITSEKD